jgi:arginase family enzyme
MFMQKFLTDEFSEDEANLITFGVPVGKDKKAVDSFRKTSWFLEFYDVDKRKNLVENVRSFDRGNVKIEDAGKIRKEIQNQDKVSLMISDAHLPTYYALKNFKGKLLVFDAHNDLYDEYLDEKIVAATNTRNKRINDTTWLRRLVEENNL